MVAFGIGKLGHTQTAGKAIYRCTATHQGDRCRLSRDHATKDQMPFHAGSFTVWDDATGEVRGKAPGAEMSHKRNRIANRNAGALLAAIDRMPSNDPMRTAAKNDLDKFIEFYGGIK
jgi:hypothetical protein